MNQCLAEQALSRLMRYLQFAGIAPSTCVSISALELVRDAVKADEHAVIPFVMERVAEHFMLSPVDVPPPAPPIARGSIGYDAE